MHRLDWMVASAYVRTPQGWILVRDIERNGIGEADEQQHGEDEEEGHAAIGRPDEHWNRAGIGRWDPSTDPVPVVSVGSRGTHECQSYITAGEVLQKMSLPVCAQRKSLFIPTCELLASIVPRMFTPRGQLVSGTTQALVLETVSTICGAGAGLGGAYRLHALRLLQALKNASSQCTDGNVSLRRRKVGEQVLFTAVTAADEEPRSPKPSLMDMPVEIIKMVVLNLIDSPEDLAALSQTCRLDCAFHRRSSLTPFYLD